MKKFIAVALSLLLWAAQAYAQVSVTPYGVPTGAWTSFTPGANCAAGSPTFTATAKWQQIAPKSTLAEWDVTVTAISTCDSSINTIGLNLPNTAASVGSAATYDFIGGAVLTCSISAGGTSISCRSVAATGAAKLATGSVFKLSAVYENQ